jgi:AcrR family transcriptional regulator
VSPRPRRAQNDVLAATLAVIAEHGVMGLSVDTVATRTGVSKATIYRHWGSRARLVHAAISSLQPPTVEPDTGSLRDDLAVLLTSLVDYFDSPTVARVFSSFLDAAVRDPELAELRQETLRAGRASFERVVHLAIARGELPVGVDVPLVVDLARAPIIYRRVVAQIPVRAADIPLIVDAVLAAFADAPEGRERPGEYDALDGAQLPGA